MAIIPEESKTRQVQTLNELSKRKVVEHNSLITSIAKMDKTPLKMFELAVSLIDTDNPPQDQTVYLSKKEMFAFFKVDDNDKHSRFKEAIEKMQKQAFFGHVPNPTYEQVASHTTGHTEAVQITFDPEIISYRELVEIYWQQTDPTDAMGQFQDRGDNYRPVIYVNSEEQRQVALASRKALAESGRFDEPIVTTIEDAQPFYPAEEEHQQFYKKNPRRYQIEEAGGRSQFKQTHWQ
ncbi:peptide-methionine (S)-S-oxide reductase MsrA [Pediococcus acidilactici]